MLFISLQSCYEFSLNLYRECKLLDIIFYTNFVPRPYRFSLQKALLSELFIFFIYKRPIVFFLNFLNALQGHNTYRTKIQPYGFEKSALLYRFIFEERSCNSIKKLVHFAFLYSTKYLQVNIPNTRNALFDHSLICLLTDQFISI